VWRRGSCPAWASALAAVLMHLAAVALRGSSTALHEALRGVAPIGVNFAGLSGFATWMRPLRQRWRPDKHERIMTRASDQRFVQNSPCTARSVESVACTCEGPCFRPYA